MVRPLFRQAKINDEAFFSGFGGISPSGRIGVSD